MTPRFKWVIFGVIILLFVVAGLSLFAGATPAPQQTTSAPEAPKQDDKAPALDPAQIAKQIDVPLRITITFMKLFEMISKGLKWVFGVFFGKRAAKGE